MVHKKGKSWHVYHQIGGTDRYEPICETRDRKKAKRIVDLFTVTDGMQIEALEEYIQALPQFEPWLHELLHRHRC